MAFKLKKYVVNIILLRMVLVMAGSMVVVGGGYVWYFLAGVVMQVVS